jgi:outer membrane protein OmpA-like peptidoglycan-associated protein
MGVGTRALGLGGAYAAVGDDASAAYYNPALLGRAWGTQILGMHALGMEVDRRTSYLALSHRLKWGALGASFITSGMSDIEGYSVDGTSTGTFNYGDIVAMLHGAYAQEYFSLGATLKYLRSGHDAEWSGDKNANGFGVDIGGTGKVASWVGLGLALRDIGSSIGSEDANKVPINMLAGVDLKPAEWFTFGFDLEWIKDEENLKYHSGIEGAFPLNQDNTLGAAARLGLNDGNFAAGLGFRVKMLEFDYAYLDEPQDFLGESHRIGVTLKLGEQPEEPSPFEYQPRKGGDTDLDGIEDHVDKCPGAAEDFDGFEDEDGCPDVDNDGDGILDVNDDCPGRAEDLDGFEDHDGCPELDNDGDGILDEDDKCPNAAETFNGYEDDDGCPDEIPGQMARVNINFKVGTAEISGADPYLVLSQIVEFMKNNPDVRVRILGHTDNTGSLELNNRLSLERADSVKTWVVEHGVAANRLVTEGKGPAVPVATNDTPEGRQRNRRIEFEIIRSQ